jgi:hypothetical protein
MRHRQCLPGRTGRRGDAAPIVVGAVCFGLVLGGLWFFRATGSAEPAAPPVAAVTAPETPQSAATPAPVAVVAPTTDEAQPVVAAQFSADELIQGHLSAGEFGPALDLALAAQEPAEQARLIRLVAEAQAAAGEFDAAFASLKKIPAGFGSPEDRQRIAREESLAGGTGADFTQLIDLIQNETGNETYGPWVDIHGTGGTVDQFDAGVSVDPHGVLALVSKTDADGRLAAVSSKARQASLNTDMGKASELRMVSLTRLERAIADRLAAGKPVVESMKQLAGLAEIQYVFVYPQDGEVVIAGPAEGWGYNAEGRAVGLDSGRPTLQLDDLVTVLRTFSDRGVNQFGSSRSSSPSRRPAGRSAADRRGGGRSSFATSWGCRTSPSTACRPSRASPA